MKQELFALLTTVVGAVIYYFHAWLRTKLRPQQLATVARLAEVSVAAAEKIGAATGIEGADKYDVAAQALTAAAKRVGLKLKPEEVSAFIHSTLAELDELRNREQFSLGFQAGGAEAA